MTETSVFNDEFTAFWNDVLAEKFEIFREAGAEAEQRRAEIENALRAELARHQQGGNAVMQSSSWTITARKPLG